LALSSGGAGTALRLSRSPKQVDSGCRGVGRPERIR
jgi:hypothetical protein